VRSPLRELELFTGSDDVLFEEGLLAQPAKVRAITAPTAMPARVRMAPFLWNIFIPFLLGG
jgi:hypothetical protein